MLNYCRCPAVFNSENFKQILQLRDLQISQNSLMRGLTMAASGINDKDAQDQYLTELLTPIRNK